MKRFFISTRFDFIRDMYQSGGFFVDFLVFSMMIASQQPRPLPRPLVLTKRLLLFFFFFSSFSPYSFFVFFFFVFFFFFYALNFLKFIQPFQISNNIQLFIIYTTVLIKARKSHFLPYLQAVRG